MTFAMPASMYFKHALNYTQFIPYYLNRTLSIKRICAVFHLFFLHGLTVQVDWLGLRVGGQLALSLHSSNELGELSQWLCHDDSTTNIISVIIIINCSVPQRIES